MFPGKKTVFKKRNGGNLQFNYNNVSFSHIRLGKIECDLLLDIAWLNRYFSFTAQSLNCCSPIVGDLAVYI